ncbi:Protein argonaute-2, partial [Pseudolycoriella hygida]
MGKKKGKSDKKSESQQQAQSQPQGRSTSQPQAAQQASAQQPQSRPPSQPQASQQARAQQPQSKPTSQPQVPQQRRSQQPQGWPTYQPQVPQQRRSQQPQGWPTYQPQVPQQGRPQQPQGWPTSQPQVLQQPSAQQPQGWPTFQPQVPQQASAQQPQGWPTSQPQVLQQARAQQPQSRPSSQPQPPSQGQSSRGKPKQPKKDTDEPKPRKKSQKNAPRQCEDTTGVADDFETMSISSGSVASSSTPTKTIPTLALFPVTQNIGSGTKGRRVMVDVNFVALCIEKLLPTVYQYDVTIEPALPKRWLPKIFEVYRQKNFNNIFVAFDGKKIAVSPKILPVNDKIEKETKVTDENGRERVYMVSMKEARDSKIDFRSLKNYTSMRQYDAPLRAMQMLEIVLKAPFLDKDGVQAGRSFFLRPGAKERYDLGDNYELWTGLYQATVLGSRPYLNVDIAHKAFPSERRVCDILIGVDLKRQLDPKNASSLQSHLNGLMIKYSLPGNNASCRSFKFMRLAADSKTEKFINDADKKEYTIESYFRSRGVTIQYPLLPTLKLGNSIKNITVPLELCVVDGNQ